MFDFIHEFHDVSQSQRAFSTGMNIHVGAAVLTGFNVTLTYTNFVICIFIFILNCKMTWKKLSDSELGHHCLVEQ